jgi:threonine dehydrogenase-like Zn-dependent dehydrogenase
MRVTIFGTGYVGLVTGACLAEIGHHVVCVDVNRTRIERLNRGEIPIYEPGLDALVERNLAKGTLEFTCHAAQAVTHAEVQFVAVGTPPNDDGAADLRYVLSVAETIGPDRTGIRLSPASPYNNMLEADPVPLYTALLNGLAAQGIAYVHLVEMGDRELTRRLRAAWPGTLILNPHGSAEAFPATADSATEALRSGVADAVSLATMWLANPDLDARIKAGGPYNTPDQATFYGGDQHGYTDYPTLEDGDEA